jgi:hypothetical protein
MHRGAEARPARLLPIMALPAIGALVLFIAMNRWGKKHDPMGGTSDDILPIGRARQSDFYRD